MAEKGSGEKSSKKPSEKVGDKPASEKPLKPQVTLAPQRKTSTKGDRPRGSFDGRPSPQLSSAKASPAPTSTTEGAAPPPIALPPVVNEENEDKKEKDTKSSNTKKGKEKPAPATIAEDKDREKDRDEGEDNKSSREDDGDDDEGDANSQAPEGEQLELKHPLQHTWTLWFDLPKDRTTIYSREKKWSYTEALSFGTVEDFWRFYNNLLEPEKLKTGSTYCLFKKGILPGWEDPANSQGGRWMVELPRSGSECEHLNNAFLMVILAMIGESFAPKESDDIVGVTTSVRKDKCRIELWTRTASDHNLQMAIGASFKKFLEIPNCPKIQFQPHAEKAGASSAKFSLTV